MVVTSLLILLLAWSAPLGGESDVVKLIEWPMKEQPRLERVAEVMNFHPRLVDMWLEALAQPDVETRRATLDTISRAHQEGMPNLEPRTADHLLRLMEARGQDQQVRLSAARALVALDSRRAATGLYRQNEMGEPQLVMLTDPALARWDYEPARAMWLERLTDPATPRSVRLSALQSLETVCEPLAAEPLLELVHDASMDDAMRLAAARALGAVAPRDQEQQAAALLQSASLTSRLAAGRLLARHESELAAELLAQLAEDPEPAVAAPAVDRLLTIAPSRIQHLIDRLIASSDANLRQLAIRALDQDRDEPAIREMAPLLRDPVPDVRHAVRQLFESYDASPSLRDAVREEAMSILASSDPRGVRQAVVLLGRLRHEAAAPRMLELLEGSDFQTHLVVVDALRRLAMPQTLKPLFRHAMFLLERWRWVRNARDIRLMNLELAQLFQLFGEADYYEAEPLLRLFIPREVSMFHDEVRMAAIWSLARFHRDKPDRLLAAQFIERLEDTRFRFSERTSVRGMAAVGLGIMKATDHLESLHRYTDSVEADDEVLLACRWAVVQMSREPLPALPPRIRRGSNWFLEPMTPN